MDFWKPLQFTFFNISALTENNLIYELNFHDTDVHYYFEKVFWHNHQ